MGYLNYCNLCKFAYTSECKYGTKQCNQERARIMLEISKPAADDNQSDADKKEDCK